MKNKYFSIMALALIPALFVATNAHAVPAVPSGPWTPPPPRCYVTTNDGAFYLYRWHECAYWESLIWANPYSNISVRWFY
jgi:hypothetical protein